MGAAAGGNAASWIGCLLMLSEVMYAMMNVVREEC